MTKEIRILILEDRPADAELAARELRKEGIQFTLQRVMTEPDFLAQLCEFAPDLILADYSLPSYDGLSALAAAQRERPEAPFIFVSGELGEETAIEALRHGATDYVLKRRLSRLGSVVRRALQEDQERRQRQQAEQALREAEARYRVLFEQSPDGIAIVDPKTARFLEFNTAAHQQLGYTREEFALLSIPDLEAMESPEETMAHIARIVRGGREDFDTRKRTKQGEIRHIHVTAQVVEVAGRKLYHCIWRDMTARKQAEEALARERELLSHLLDTMPDHIYFKDTQSRFLRISAAQARNFGLREPGDALGKTDADFFDTVHAQEARADEQRVMATGQAVVGKEEREVWPDGRVTWVSTTKLPLRDAVGNVIGIMGISRDVTERKQAEERVQQLNQLLRAIRDVNQLIVQERDPSRLLTKACTILAQGRGFPLAWIGLVEAGSKRVLPAARAGEGADYVGTITVTWDEAPTGRGPTGTAIRSGRPCACQDTAADPLFAPWRERALAHGFASVAAVPMIRQERVLGAVTVYSGRAGAFDAEELALMTEMAADLALALHNIELENERKQAELRTKAFANLGQRLSAARTASEAADIIVEVANQLLGWEACTLDLYDREQETVFHVLNRDTVNGRRVDFPSSCQNEPPSAFARRAIESGGQLILKDDPQVTVPGGRPIGDTTRPSASIILVPIRQGAEVIGLLSVHSYTSKAYDEHSMETLQTLADHCAGALGRIRAHAALAESERSYREIFNASQDAIFIHDAATGAILDSNQGAVELFGYSHAELRNLGGDLFCADDSFTHAEARRRLRLAFAEGPQVFEWHGKRKSGELFWAEVTLRGARIAGEDRVLAVGRDITERKSAELRIRAFSQLGQRLNATRAAKEAAQIIVEAADQLLGWDACSFALYSPAEKLVHHVLNRDTVDGRRIENPPGYDHAPPSPLAKRAIEQGGQLILKEHPEQMTPGGVAFGNKARSSASILFVPIRNGTEVIGVMTIQSYTPRAYDRHGLDTLQALADYCGAALERITKEEALHTAQQKLRQSQKMEAIGQLAGGVAHDFNNMLAVIRGNAELLMMDPDQFTTETKDGLKQIMAASERAANLTRQLLTFSRKQVMQLQPLVLNNVVAELAKMLKRIIGEQVDLQCRYANPLPFVQADAGMIEQVLVNLAVNARDAMPHGGQLLISTESVSLDATSAQDHLEARAGEFVCLTVADAGTGIAPELLPRIFEPFFTTKDVGKGTGLGLATAYGILKQHQGWIQVSSQLGAGTTFKLFLPAIPTPAQKVVSSKAEAELPFGTETILLVEDDYAVCVITRQVLESHGYTVYEARTAREGLKLWHTRAEEIALLLTDIVMPEGMTGRELAEQLRALSPALKVIFMSGYSADVIGKDTDFFRRSQSLLLQKPCSASALLGAVRQCLDEK